MRMLKLFRVVLLGLIFSAMGSVALASADPVYTSRFSDVAVSGYDPVAYFTKGEPTKGSVEITTNYMGAIWRFSSEENAKLFLADPSKYAPQYGGYCSWAAAAGYTASGDPKRWKIVDGKLYLNYNGRIQKRWEKDIPGFIEQGNANWPDVVLSED